MAEEGAKEVSNTRVDSREYEWRYLTASALLSHGPCEICTVLLLSGAAAGTLTAYDGENTNGDIIALFEGLAAHSNVWKFYKPVYCRRGLYVVLDQNCASAFVQWRNLGHIIRER